MTLLLFIFIMTNTDSTNSNCLGRPIRHWHTFGASKYSVVFLGFLLFKEFAELLLRSNMIVILVQYSSIEYEIWIVNTRSRYQGCSSSRVTELVFIIPICFPSLFRSMNLLYSLFLITPSTFGCCWSCYCPSSKTFSELKWNRKKE
jgi:hypothetical protein